MSADGQYAAPPPKDYSKLSLADKLVSKACPTHPAFIRVVVQARQANNDCTKQASYESLQQYLE
jgi:hypothetical protein